MNELYYLYCYDFNVNVGSGTRKIKAIENVKGVCEQVSQRLNKKMSNNDRRSVPKNDFVFHALKQDGKIFLAITGAEAKLRIVYGCLEAAADDPKLAEVSHLSKKAGKVLQKTLDYYNDPGNDEIEKCKTKIDQIKEVMIDNLDKLFENLASTEDLLQSTEELQSGAVEFKKGGGSLKRGEQKKMILIIIVCLVVLGLICLAVVAAAILLFLALGGGTVLIAFISLIVSKFQDDNGN